jgi:predicted GNAT family N-acyltransferase
MELTVINYESPFYHQVLDLRNRVLRMPLGMNLFDEDLREDKDQYIVVVIKENIVAACVMLKILDKDTVKLRQMAVEPEFQKTGLGSMLIGYAENFCVLNDYFSLELHARKTAIPFYLKLGYEEVGREFEEVNLPHIRMYKQLAITPIS